jgi:hypothetical protein
MTLLLSLVFSVAQAVAKENALRPEGTERALVYILKEGSILLNGKSGCRDDARPKRLLRDFLAMEMATFVDGSNQITGKCSSGKTENCEIHIRHANGEEVSSADLTFQVVSGRFDRSSLRCSSTP